MIKWIYGNFNGAIQEIAELPVSRSQDAVVEDIHGVDVANISVIKSKLKVDDWTVIIKVDAMAIACVDTDKEWDEPGAVLFYGKINKISGAVGDLIKIQAVGYSETLAAVTLTPYLIGGTENPNEGLSFKASTWQGVYKDIFEFIPRLPQMPQLLTSISGDSSGEGKEYITLLSDNTKFLKALEYLRDTEADTHNEFRFIPHWKSAAKNRIGFKAVISPDDKPQLNWDKTFEINLSAAAYKSLSFSLSLTSETVANRIIGQTKRGDSKTGTGADYTVLYEDNGLPLQDAYFIPNAELSKERLLEEMRLRLKDLKAPKGEASYTMVANQGDALEMLGAKIIFKGEPETDTAGFDVTVRCTAVRFGAGTREVTLDIMLPQMVYPKIPSSTKRSDIADNKDKGIGNGGGYGNGYDSPSLGGGLPGGGVPGNFEPPVITPPGDVTPPDIAQPVDEFNARKLATNGGTTIAISEDNKLFGWGNNGSGTVGVGYDKNDTGNIVIVPKEIIADDNPDKKWLAVFTPVLPNGGAAYAIDEDEVLWGWGLMPSVFGEEEGTDLVPIEKPILLAENASDLMQYENYGVGNVNYPAGVYILKGDGRLFGIGTQPFGSASGTSTKEHPLVPWPNADERFTRISSNNFWHTALNSDGEVYEWGTYTNHGFEPVKLKNDVRFKDIQVGFGNFAGSFKMGITQDNSFYVWGNGPYGGDTPGSSLEPKRHTQIDKVSQFIPSYFATHIVLPDGTLWAAGNNNQGQLGVGIDTPSQFSKFVQVGEDNNWLDAFWSKPVADGGTWVIKSNGELWVWGLNDYGQQGTGDGISHATAFRVGEDSDWVRVSGQRFGALAVKRGKMMITGYNNQGQLGNNTLQPYTAWTRQDGTEIEEEETP